MSFRERLDLLLVALLQVQETRGAAWADLQALARALGFDNPLDVIEAARFLEQQGYIRADMRIGGAIDAQIAPPGTMYLQDMGAGLPLLGQKVLAALGDGNLENFITGKPVEDPLRVDRRLAFEKIEALRQHIERLGLTDALRDSLDDLDILNRELERPRPNRELVDRKLHALAELALPLGYEVRELVELMSL